MPVSLPDDETFSSFVTGNNQLLLKALLQTLRSESFRFTYFWAGASSGRTHLLHAICSEAATQHQRASYIPLEQHALFTPEIFDGLEQCDVICLDNLQAIVGQRIWEEAIFDLYNRLSETQQTNLVVSADLPPKQLPFVLPDLQSRMNWGEVYQLHKLSDADKLQALQLRAKLRGFELPDEVGLFLLKRLDRDMRFLFNTLEKLDIASITEQRKLTIPFVKDVLNI